MARVPERWTVVVTAARACREIALYRDALEPAGCTVVARPAEAERLDEDAMLAVVADADALICGDDRLTDRVLAAAPHLRLVVKWGTGIDSIDLAAAARRGVVVGNTPDAFSQPVADTVLGYLLLVARGLDRMDADVRAGRWMHRPLRALHECTLGIVGFGHIGRAVSRRAAAFGMRVMACDLEPIAPEVAAETGAAVGSFDDVLAHSDFVSLHADYRPENFHLIDAGALARMQPGSVLVNTARGRLVDEAALVEALRGGRLAAAALDVFEEEPLPSTSPLRALPNVYLAPHNSNSSPVAAARVHQHTIGHVLQALAANQP